MTTHEFAPPSPEWYEDDIRLLNTLKADFMHTYRFSQGDMSLQHDVIMPLVARQYQRTLPTDRLAKIPELMEQAAYDVTGRRNPHTPEDPEGGAGEFGIAWGRLKRAFRTETAESDDLQLLASFQEGMIARDDRFVEEGRSKLTRDPFESQYREYVLERRSTRSTAFDTIFDQMHDIAVTQNTPNPLLQVNWEARHPEEHFYSNVFIAERNAARSNIALVIGSAALLDPAGLTGFES